MKLLGVDVGSTTIKAGVFSAEGALISLGRRKTPLGTFTVNDGTSIACWFPDQLWNEVTAAIQEALRDSTHVKEIGGISVSGFGSDAVPLDPSGDPLFPFISFYEKATIEQMNQYGSLIDEYESYSITGIRSWYYLTLLRVLWTKKYQEEVYNKASVWLIVTDFINFKLCGAKKTDFSEASTTLAFDQQNLSWSENILRTCGIEREIFPQPLNSGEVIGQVTADAAEETGLRAGTPVVLGGHDNMTSFFAASRAADDFVIVTGTFESLMISSKLPVITRDGMRKNLVCEKGVVKDQYILWGVQYAGGIVEWIRETFFQSDCSCNDELFDCLENTSCGANGMLMLPHIFGSMSPVEDPFSRGCFVGISENAVKQDFLRAAVEGINYQSRLIYESLLGASRAEPAQIINIGGAAYSDFWMQNRADILGKEIIVPDIPESTLLGAAMLAGVGVGIYSDFDDAVACTKQDVRHFAPDSTNRDYYQEFYEGGFKNLYSATKSVHHFLAEKHG